ncbi:MAG: glycosyltransferase family 4 protein [Acidobacteriota bacterium]|nr:glycosyltransferase family 4 protein [Acidobacteriota bacterium]
MRILCFVHAFRQPDAPGRSRPYQLARHWARAGHLVTVLASGEEGASGRALAATRLVAREDVDGVRVLRVWTSGSLPGDRVRPRLDAATFGLTATLTSFFRGASPDLVYAALPPWTTGTAALAAAASRRLPLVLEVRDPQTALQGVARRLLARGLLSRASTVVTTSQDEVDVVRQLSARDRAPLVVPDGLDDWMLEAGEVALRETPGPLRLVCCGPFGEGSGVGQVVDAAILLGADAPVEFLFIGGGAEAEALERRAARHHPAPCRFVPLIAKTELFEQLRRAGAGVVSVAGRAASARPIPAAVYDVMAAGRPLLVVADGESARLVRDAGCGRVVPPGRPSLLADAVRGLAVLREDERRTLGASGRRYLIDGRSYRDRAWQLLRLFEELTGKAADDRSGAAVPRLVEQNRT